MRHYQTKTTEEEERNSRIGAGDKKENWEVRTGS